MSMKKLSPFLLSFVIFCIFQYLLHVFYYSSDDLKSKNCNYASFNITEEDLDGIFDTPSRQVLIERGELNK